MCIYIPMTFGWFLQNEERDRKSYLIQQVNFCQGFKNLHLGSCFSRNSYAFIRFWLTVICSKKSYRYHLTSIIFIYHDTFPPDNSIFKLNNRNTGTKCDICSKLTIKTPDRCQWCRSGVFIVNFEHISHLVLVFLLLNLGR